jgi:hypothetical protein
MARWMAYVSTVVWLFALLPAGPVRATTIVVTSTADAGPGSLRAAIAAAAPGDIIAFSPTVFPPGVLTSILLTSGELTLDKDLTIQGPGAASLAIDGNAASRVFTITGGTVAMISDLTVRNGNGVSAVVSGDGGGVYSLGGTVMLTNTTISGNTVRGSGGGVSSLAGTVTLTNTTVSGNTAGGGGGVYNTSGTLTLTNTTISGNTASSGGGGIYNDDFRDNGTLSTLTNTTISGNTASTGGGGVANAWGGRLTLTNATISGNTTSSSSGGGVSSNSGTVTLTNTIISRNTTNSGDGNCSGANIISGGNSLEFPGSGAGACSLNAALGDKIGADPLLGTLTLNPPGTTATHALLQGSAAIDGVTFQTGVHCTGPVGAGTPTPVTTDQRGVPRPQGPACDIGAYEFQSPTPTPTPTFCILADINCDGIVDVRDYGIWRQHFGATVCGDLADLNGDCLVDIRDYGVWRQNFGNTAGAGAPRAAPPARLPAGPATPTPSRTPARR